MRVYPDKLSAHLSKSISPVYIVSGDEPLLVQEVSDQIRLHLKKKGYLERELFHVDASFDWDEVLFSANSMSLFAEQKILELRIPNGKPGDKGAKALSAYCESPPEGTVMLLILPKLTKPNQGAKWFKTLDATGVFVQLWPIEKKDLPGWIGQRMKANGLQADRGATQVLIDRLEGNLLALVQEIERLKLLSPDGKVDAELVMNSVADNTRFDVFGLIDTALAQDQRQTLKMVQGLRGEGVDILSVNSMFAREVRSLLQMIEALDAGQSTAAVMTKFKVWQKRKGLVTKCLQLRSRGELFGCLKHAAEVDARVKGMSTGDPWIPLESGFLALAGVNLPG